MICRCQNLDCDAACVELLCDRRLAAVQRSRERHACFLHGESQRFTVISEGKKNTPGFKSTLTQADIDSLTAFTRTVGK
jgi:hypothetical protein